MKNRRLFTVFFNIIAVPMIISVFTSAGNESVYLAEEITDNAEELIFNAVRTEHDWTRQHGLRTRLLENPYFRRSKIYMVRVSTDYSPTYIVAADEAGNTDVFSPRRDAVNPSDVTRFSRVIKKENIEVTGNNVKSYVSSFLFLADYNSVQVDDTDDIEHVFPYIKMFIKDGSEYAGALKPLAYEADAGKTVIKFCSWKNRGCLRKWNLEILPDGEILSWKAENIAVFYF